MHKTIAPQCLFRFLMRILVLCSFTLMNTNLAHAQFSPPSNMSATSAREYYVGRDFGKPLITVNLLNGVGNPGVYHVPNDTDIAQLIAYAGGATPLADLTSLTIRRASEHGVYHITELNLEKALHEPSDLFRIQDQDIVQIEQHVNPERTLVWVSIVSAIASIVLSVYLIRSLH
jgi:hypothetical protein